MKTKTERVWRTISPEKHPYGTKRADLKPKFFGWERGVFKMTKKATLYPHQRKKKRRKGRGVKGNTVLKGGRELQR